MDDARVEPLRRLAEPILASESVELVELISHQQGGQLMVRLLVDRVGGVRIQDCTRLSQLLNDALDRTGLLSEGYALEVSSPGLDRPLATKRDFERAIGEDVELDLTESVRGSKRLTGRLLAVQHEAIVVTTRTGNVTIPLTQIRFAVKAVKWS